jgi:hypothetical protein
MPNYVDEARAQYAQSHDKYELINHVWKGINDHARNAKVAVNATRNFVALTRTLGKQFSLRIRTTNGTEVGVFGHGWENSKASMERSYVASEWSMFKAISRTRSTESRANSMRHYFGSLWGHQPAFHHNISESRSNQINVTI